MMNKKELHTLAKKAAKSMKTEADLNKVGRCSPRSQ